MKGIANTRLRPGIPLAKPTMVGIKPLKQKYSLKSAPLDCNNYQKI